MNNPQKIALRILQAEAWDDGYQAARQDLINGASEPAENPFDNTLNDE